MPQLSYEAEAADLSELIGSLLGTREGQLASVVGKARHAGQPFDPDRITLFETLFNALRDTLAPRRPVPERDGEANATLAFFEAYLSNFIEGTEFTVEEAAEIVFEGVIPQERPADAHDVWGTFRIVSDLAHLKVLPTDFGGFLELLRRRHATVMEAREDKAPGAFKERENRAGNTVFVAPELVASDQERIIIPTAYRTHYLGALKAFSQNGRTDPLIRMLEAAQSYTHRIDWSRIDSARANLAETNAFAEGADA